MIEFKQKKYNCPLEMSIDLIGGKWKVIILWNLHFGPLRFNELRRIFPDVTQKILTQQLKDLENDGLIVRTVYPERPPKVEYSLSELGSALIPALKEISEWGNNYMKIKKINL